MSTASCNVIGARAAREGKNVLAGPNKVRGRKSTTSGAESAGHASPGQRPGSQHRPIVWRPEGARGPSAFPWRTLLFGPRYPVALPQAGILRDVGAVSRLRFQKRPIKKLELNIGTRDVVPMDSD